MFQFIINNTVFCFAKNKTLVLKEHHKCMRINKNSIDYAVKFIKFC